MENETNKLIEQLAIKLGTTTEYLFGILVKQAYYDSLISLFQFLLLGIFIFIFYKIHKKLSLVKEYNGYERTGYCYYGESATLSMFSIGAILVILTVICFFYLPSVINGFINPEYWALEKILNKIN